MPVLPRLAGALVALLLSATATATEPPVFATGAGAIRGYDPVAFFTEGRPVAGDPAISHDWNGARWHFANEASRDAFVADPARYAPQYGGYCAYAVSQGYTASIDPQAWSIVDGRLYLNYSRGVQQRWDRRRGEYIRAADANWPGVLE